MKAVRRAVWWTVAALVVSVAAGCAKKPEPATVEPQTVSGVRLVEVAAAEVPDTVELVGTVRARESATLSAEVMGRIAKIAVREGDRVRTGQTLVVLTAAQLGAQAAQAEASVAAIREQVAAAESEAALAASTLRRYEKLKEQKSVSPQEFDQVQTRAQAAQAHLAALRSQEAAARSGAEAARTMQGYTTISAPFNGVVTRRMADPGTLAAPGVPLLTVEGAGALRLEASVDESLLPLVRVGAAIPVTLDALGAKQLQGKVVEVVPAADPGSRSFVVKIALPKTPGLHSGIFGRAGLARGSRQAFLVPRSAVVARGSLEAVYVVGADGIAQLRYVSTGTAHADALEVLSGLSAAERVVEAPGERDLGGKRIEAGR
jgi:RND family efflux transporter MFP subunit